MKKRYSLWTRLLTLALCLVMVLSLVPDTAVLALNGGILRSTTGADGKLPLWRLPAATEETEGPTEVPTEAPTELPAEPQEETKYGTITMLGDLSELDVVQEGDSAVFKAETGAGKTVTMNSSRGTATGSDAEADGWWVNFQIEAPQNANLKKAKFLMPNQEKWQNFTEGKESTGKREIRLNIDQVTVLTPKVLLFKFDWNGDGTGDQEFELTLKKGTSASPYLIQKKTEQTLEFEEATVTLLSTAETYVNPLKGVFSASDVTFSIDNRTIARVDRNSGKLTLTGETGTATVTATFQDNKLTQYYKYSSSTITYTLEVSEEKFKFAEETLTRTYAPELVDLPELLGVTGEVTYGVDNKDVAEIEKISNTQHKLIVNKAGKVTVSATQPKNNGNGNGQGNKVDEAHYTLTIQRAPQTLELDGEPKTEWYLTDGSMDLPKVKRNGTSLQDGQKPKCTVDGVAHLENDKIVFDKVGKFTLTMYMPQDDCYLQSKNLVMEFAVQNRRQEPGFAFAQPNVTCTYGEQVASWQTASGGQVDPDATIAYESSDDTIAAVDNTGAVTVKKAGTVIITARKTIQGYEDATAEYTLTIQHASQKFTIDGAANALEVACDGGTLAGKGITIQERTDKTDNFVYTIENVVSEFEGWPVEASVAKSNSPETHSIQLGVNSGTGTFTVRITRPEDDWYAEYSAEYQVWVQDNGSSPCTVVGVKKNPDSKWYTGVQIRVPEAEKGTHEISFNSQLGSWFHTLDYAVQGETQAKYYYREKPQGTDMTRLHGYTTETIWLDSTLPGVKEVTYAPETVSRTILEKIFFFFKDEVTVTVTAEDEHSGVAKLFYSTDGTDYTEIGLDQDTSSGFLKTNSGSFKIDAAFRGKIYYRIVDDAGNVQDYNPTDILVVDKDAPVITGTYTEEKATLVGDTLYTSAKNFTLTLTCKDSNYDLADCSVQVNGEEAVLTEDTINNCWTVKLPFTQNGKYVVTAKMDDHVHDIAEYSQTVVVDDQKPVIAVTPTPMDENAGAPVVIGDKTYYQCGQKVTVMVTDANLKSGSLAIMSGDAEVEYLDWIANDDGIYTWTKNFDTDDDYTLTVTAVDQVGNPETKTCNFAVDTQAPTVVATYNDSIRNATDEYYSKDSTVNVAVKGADAIGIRYYLLEYTEKDGQTETLTLDADRNIVPDKSTVTDYFAFLGSKDSIQIENQVLSFAIAPPFNGKLRFGVVDYAGRTAWEMKDDVEKAPLHVIVDNVAPKVTITYDTTTYNLFQSARAFSNPVKVTVTVTDANFDPNKTQLSAAYSPDRYKLGKYEDTKVSFTPNGPDTYTAEFTLGESRDGAYKLQLLCQDAVGNDMEWTETYRMDNHQGTYTSDVMVVDTQAPVVTVQYMNVYPGGEAVSNGDGAFACKRKAVITVKDWNFHPNWNMNADSGKGVDFGVKVTSNSQPVSLPDLTSLDHWTHTENTNTWVAEVPFDVAGIYEVTLQCADIAGKAMANAIQNTFTLDMEAPQGLEITYSKSLFHEVLEGVTFGYYNAPATVTLKAKDSPSGVDYFTLTAKAKGPEASTTAPLPKKAVIHAENGAVEGETPGFLQGQKIVVGTNAKTGVSTVSFQVPAEFRGDFEFTATDKAGTISEAYRDQNVVVVDQTAPKCSVTYSTEGRKTVNERFYYKQTATVTIKITEANFFAEDVTVLVNNVAVPVKNWESHKAVNTGTLTLSEEGVYNISVEYKDRSENAMESIRCDPIVVDTSLPEIQVQYGSTPDVKKVGDRIYYAAAQTATVTITERNFLAKNVKFTVTDGKNAVPFTAGKWTHNGDIHSVTLTFVQNANYTFDVEYTDLAGNKAADYPADQFTVDTEKPTGLSIGINQDLGNTIGNAIFFRGQTSVTLRATDRTAGVDHFAWGTGGSTGNDLDVQSRDGDTATATFQIPGGAGAQFDGTISFAAFDRSGNSSTYSNGQRLVVDTISPTASVSYNAPVKETGAGAYYAGEIRGTISIQEANFDASAISVTVTRDGAAYPVSVSWSDNGRDSHTGSFVLAEDGAYQISITGKDQAQNTLAPYSSRKMTVDTKNPTVQVSGIQPNTANKDPKYGFTVVVGDTNLDPAAMQPVLTAVLRGGDGNFTTKEIDLGAPVSRDGGRSYTYAVENLTEDAIYTLSCKIQDLSGNTETKMVLDDGKTYEKVQFSVNRKGSTFAFGDDATEQLANQYYIYSVDGDVVLVEVNVDPVEDYTLTLNGVELKEGADYTTSQSSKPGEWNKRTYSIRKELFAQEGAYSIVVSSTDKARTTAYSDIKNLSAAFVVDRTAPVLTVTGLESGGRYQTEEQLVTVIPTDEGGRLSSLRVVATDGSGDPLRDSSGADISVRLELSGEELLNALEENAGKLTFTVPKGLNSRVQIVCKDAAVNGEGEANTTQLTYHRVTVSQSGIVIFYANTPLFLGVLGAVLAALVLLLVIWKRKKDEKSKKPQKAKA